MAINQVSFYSLIHLIRATLLKWQNWQEWDGKVAQVEMEVTSDKQQLDGISLQLIEH